MPKKKINVPDMEAEEENLFEKVKNSQKKPFDKDEFEYDCRPIVTGERMDMFIIRLSKIINDMSKHGWRFIQSIRINVSEEVLIFERKVEL